jgi:hypothetical protein
MQRARFALVLLCAAAVSARGQAPKSIDPGMSQAQVVERLGDPTLSRSSGDFTYLFYKNGCVRSCGIDDVVILRKDSVVDALFRSPERAYSGKSSSPRMIPADVAARTRPGGRDSAAAPVAVQAGEPRAPSNADSTAPKPAAPKRARHHRPKAAAPATQPDSITRDSIMKGSLRIKVMPKNFKPPKDSVRTDSVAQRPPHDE